jgi:hypothetical protein
MNDLHWDGLNTSSVNPIRNVTTAEKRSDQVSGFVVLPKRHHCVAQSVPKARQGLGESQPKGARVLAPRLNPPHAQKTMQSSLKSPDGL